MAYTNNPNLPRVRMQVVELVKRGWSVRKAARYSGFAHNTILNWIKRKPEYGWHNQLIIPTWSSRPHHHPRQLSSEIIERILSVRMERHQCAEIIQYRLKQENILVGLSSVKRILKRYGCSKYSRWKKWHKYIERPLASNPGILVELDTIWFGQPDNRLYVYTLLDVYSRWAYALACEKINTYRSLNFVKRARNVSPFMFRILQSDHGSEFSKYFTKQILAQGLTHRHSRVRTPSDNGHLERFNRTLQEECLNKLTPSLNRWQKAIPEYLNYYNNERPHMGLNMQTPMQVVRSY